MHVDPEVTPPDEPVIPEILQAPPQLVDVANEYRLIPMLRAAARTKNPELILAWSATEFFNAARAPKPDDKQAITELATALADLAVTGRAAYDQFNTGLNLLAVEGSTRLRIGARSAPPPATDAEIASAMKQALDRAFAVAWALRGLVAQRAELRARLGWIAVSAEDDSAHRPVNMPAPPYEQFEATVTTPLPGGRRITLATRYLVAMAEDVAHPREPVLPRALPYNPLPNIPPDHQILLFLHGHSSSAEEALAIIPHLIKQGLKRGTKFAVISVDLPNNGYSETFDHTRIAPTRDTTFPFLPSDTDPIATPILDFIEEFVVAFVDSIENTTALNALPRIQNRIAGVIGGSLGGNLCLRLGRRKNMPAWLKRTIVAWSPASVWKAKVKHDPSRHGPRTALKDCAFPETEGSRRQYFDQAYDHVSLPGLVNAQPNYWYRKDYGPKHLLVALSRLARRETYNPHFRRWHWRVAGEQLIYSHVENEVYGDRSTPVRYTQNTVRTLLAAGEGDNSVFTRIYKATRDMGKAMVRTPGRRLLVRGTGHAIHLERPQYFASEIVKFVLGGPAKSMQIRCATRRAGRIIRVGGIDHTDQVPFDLTQQDCIAAITKGDAFYVIGPDGNDAAVVVGQQRVDPGPFGVIRYFIKTEADESEPNNLAFLPPC